MDFLVARYLPAQGARRRPGKHSNGVAHVLSAGQGQRVKELLSTSPRGGKGPGTLNQHARSVCYRNLGFCLSHVYETATFVIFRASRAPRAHLSCFCTWATAGLATVHMYPLSTAADPTTSHSSRAHGFTFSLFRNNVLPTAQQDGGVGDTSDREDLGVPQTSDMWPHLGASRQQPTAGLCFHGGQHSPRKKCTKGLTCSLSIK